jgi:hypothetical protein
VGRSRDLLLVLLVLRLVVSDRQGSALVLLSPEFRMRMHAVRDDVERVAAIKGDVFCSNKVVCRAAGKPFVVDEFKMEELVATGKMTEDDIAALLWSRHVTTFKSSDQTTVNVLDTSLSKAWRKPQT